MERLLSVQEVADRLGVSLWTVYRLSRRGELGSVRIGRRRLFAVTDLEELVQATRRERRAGSQPPVSAK